MDTNTLSFGFELKSLTEEDGTFEGYASMFEVVDNGMDVVSRGAFAKSLATGRSVKMLWQHDPEQIIGKWESIAEDERGLYVKGRLFVTDIPRAREAIRLLREGVLDSMSIGYRTKMASQEGNGSVRRLDEVDLFEISLVTFPMLDAAKVTSVKSIKTIRDFEKTLRDVGFSQTEAKAIAADGYKGLTDHRDDAEVDEAKDDLSVMDAVNSLKSLLEKMQND